MNPTSSGSPRPTHERRTALSRRAVILGCIALAGWQASYLATKRSIPKTYEITGALGGSGTHLEGFSRFARFFRASGYYPLASLSVDSTERLPSGEAFSKWADLHGESLVMEVHDTYRIGDRGKVFLLWLDSFRGTRSLSYWRVNVLFFIAALVTFVVGFWKEGHGLFGFAGAILAGSSTFQLYEVYGHSNIFCWPIIALLFVMGLNAFALAGRTRTIRPVHVGIALGSGVFLALVREIRSDPAVLLLSIAVAYLVMTGVQRRARALLVSVLLIGFVSTGSIVAWHLDSLYERTRQFVVEKGGHPYDGPRRSHHHFWHPVYCGLGDYASELGYEWNDFTAYEYGLKKLREAEPNLWPDFPGKAGTGIMAAYFMDTSWDAAGLYRRKLEDDPRYEPILREKIVADMKAHPFVFVKVYLSRLWRVLWDTSGVQLNLPGLFPISLNFPGFGLIAFPALWLAIRRRDGLGIRAILFSTPLLAVALVINAKLNMQYFSLYALFSFLVLAGYALRRLDEARRARLAPAESK